MCGRAKVETGNNLTECNASKKKLIEKWPHSYIFSYTSINLIISMLLKKKWFVLHPSLREYFGYVCLCVR